MQNDTPLPDLHTGKAPVSSIRPAAFIGPRILAGLFLVTALVIGAYLLTSRRVYGIGFPLDDAWIHQTYARNLALQGEWAFIPGQPSAGSTAPLWSALLSIGYLLRISPFVWTFLLGGLCLFALSLVGEAWFRAVLPDLRSPIPWAALFLIGEWHLAWAAVSGMETLLFGLCLLLVLWRCRQAARLPGWAWGWIGLLIGLSVWVRPDGITLLGPAALTLFLTGRGFRARMQGLLWLGLGAALLIGPYFLFNQLVSGSLLPNTFYAKQAEYAVQRELPLLVRLFNELKLPLIGSGLFLLPGFMVFIDLVWRRKDWAGLSAVIWFAGYGLLYALRLPVTYQYGRYFMPAMPVYFIAGLVGTAYGLQMIQVRKNRILWLLARVGVLSGLVVWLAFFGIGAGQFAQNVAIIETEMVPAARWVAANTAPDALIAAHDIGAMGYFGQRRILDLAGLVSPEVIPFIRDESQLAHWLDARHVDYLVVLTGWYAHLPDGKTPVFQANGTFSAQAGGGSMWVYRWKP